MGPDACHGGPPTGLLVRALEHAAPDMRLARISVELGRTVPMAGFTIRAEITRGGRATANTSAAIVDGDGKVRATATGMHIAVADPPIFEARIDNLGHDTPRLAELGTGRLPDRAGRPRPAGVPRRRRDALPARRGQRPGRHDGVDAHVPLLPDEEMSPFQRISPLADCGNAFGRNADPDQVQFINTDL